MKNISQYWIKIKHSKILMETAIFSYPWSRLQVLFTILPAKNFPLITLFITVWCNAAVIAAPVLPWNFNAFPAPRRSDFCHLNAQEHSTASPLPFRFILLPHNKTVPNIYSFNHKNQPPGHFWVLFFLFCLNFSSPTVFGPTGGGGTSSIHDYYLSVSVLLLFLRFVISPKAHKCTSSAIYGALLVFLRISFIKHAIR